jgi:ABC-type enterochelin transport system permease subunit
LSKYGPFLIPYLVELFEDKFYIYACLLIVCAHELSTLDLAAQEFHLIALILTGLLSPGIHRGLLDIIRIILDEDTFSRGVERMLLDKCFLNNVLRAALDHW